MMCVLSMVIWSELRTWQYRDHGHREEAPNITIRFRDDFNPNSYSRISQFVEGLSEQKFRQM